MFPLVVTYCEIHENVLKIHYGKDIRNSINGSQNYDKPKNIEVAFQNDYAYGPLNILMSTTSGPWSVFFPCLFHSIPFYDKSVFSILFYSTMTSVAYRTRKVQKNVNVLKLLIVNNITHNDLSHLNCIEFHIITTTYLIALFTQILYETFR